MVRILVIGSGGREHALVWKLAQGGQVSEILVAPGNGGTAQGKARNVPVKADDIDGLLALAEQEHIDLVVPGPELPLTLGIADGLREKGIACFGPDSHCARLEGSKAFAKSVMARAGVPTAKSAVFRNLAEARQYVENGPEALVIKADGLAAGKGVVVSRSRQESLAALDEIMGSHAFGSAGDCVVLEEFLEGEEVSLLCLCDGQRALPLPSAQDHKAAHDGDQGPNTGGMGAYSPAPILPDSGLEAMADLTVRPILREMAKDGHPFVGVLYAGLMITADGPKVLEYNVRFGDPECQPLLMRLDGDLAAIMLDCVHGRLDPAQLRYRPETALGVVLAARGYPGSYAKGMPITGLDEAAGLQNVTVFHSGTAQKDGQVVSNGGRVLCVTALGRDLAAAQARAYEAMHMITMPDSFCRSDIGAKGIRRLAAQ